MRRRILRKFQILIVSVVKIPHTSTIVDQSRRPVLYQSYSPRPVNEFFCRRHRLENASNAAELTRKRVKLQFARQTSLATAPPMPQMRISGAAIGYSYRQ